MRAKAQIDKKGAALTRDKMARHLGAHLCRCTGYVKVLDAIEAVAQGADVHADALGRRGSVGGREVRSAPSSPSAIVATSTTSGCPGMLHAALHLTDHARADIVAIDTSAALAAPGVVAVFTAADIPGELRVGIIYKDWPVMIPVGGRTSYAGDVLAVVVADTRDHARAAAELVEVTYDVHTPDHRRRRRDRRPTHHVGVGHRLERAVDQRLRPGRRRGGPRRRAHHRARDVPDPAHRARLPRTGVHPRRADRRRRRPTLHVYSGGQGVWDDRDQIASLLAVDPSRVTVELVSNGGAFGGKEDMSNQAQTALAAWLLERPVKCTLSREESFRMHAKRHPIGLEYWAGCDADGKLTALRVRGIGDSGAYASVGMKVLERAAGHACGPYRWPTIDVESIAVRTNNPVCGAFRGFGANQAQFAMEGVLDRLAEQVGISGWEIRKRNVIQPGEVWGPGQIMDDGCRRCRGVPRRRSSRPTTRRSPRARRSGSGSG